MVHVPLGQRSKREKTTNRQHAYYGPLTCGTYLYSRTNYCNAALVGKSQALGCRLILRLQERLQKGRFRPLIQDR